MVDLELIKGLPFTTVSDLFIFVWLLVVIGGLTVFIIYKMYRSLRGYDD